MAEEEIAALEGRQAVSNPPFFINVPRHYQLIQHLLVAESGKVWLFIKSQEIVQETGQSILQDVHAYMNTTLEKYFETTVRMQRLMIKLCIMVH